MDNVLFDETHNNKIIVIAAFITYISLGMLSTIQITFQKPLGNHPVPDDFLQRLMNLQKSLWL